MFDVVVSLVAAGPSADSVQPQAGCGLKDDSAARTHSCGYCGFKIAADQQQDRMFVTQTLTISFMHRFQPFIQDKTLNSD